MLRTFPANTSSGFIHVFHYDDVTMNGMASQITSLTIVYSTVYPGADQRKHQSPVSLTFVREIHRGPVNSPHKWPVTRKMFPFDDVIMFFFQVYVFSAFYDPRPDAGGPAIRVLAMGWQAEYRTIGDLYCQLWYDQQEQPVVTLAEYNRIYRSTRYPEMYVSHFILCHGQFSSTKTLPFAMSVTAEPCSKPENQLLILNKNTTVKKQGHALCLPFLYYFKPPLITSLIELVEFHRLLGVERITMYYNPIDLKFKEVRGFLDYYHKNISLIEVVPWILPRGLLIDYHAQRAAINECFYRSMNNFNFVTISDIDEIIMPRAAKSLPELMNIIDKPNRGAFSFQHFHFKEKNKGDQIKMNPHLISQTAVHRTDKSYPAGKIRCKTIYKSSKAIKLDIHYAYELVSSAESYLVDPREGMLHHYRKTPMSTMRDESKFNYIRDIYAQNWKKNLLDRVTKVLGVIK